MALGVKMQLINKKELEKEYSSYLDSLSKKYKLDVKINTTINEQMKQTEQNTRKNTKAQDEQNKSLQELIHLRKTAQIDAQKFIQDASKYRQQEEFVNLTKKEQVQLVQMLTKAEKEHSSVLNSKTNIINTINKQNEAEKQVNATIQKQIVNYQELFAVKSKALTGKYGTLVNSTDLNTLQGKVSSLTVDNYDTETLKAYNTEFQKIKTNAVNNSSALKLATQDARSFGDEIIRSAKKFAEWLLIGTALMQSIRFLESIVTTVIELDDAITDLKKVSSEIGNTVGIKEFLTDVNKLAIEVGHNTKAAIDSITDFKRLGYSLQESQTLAKQALIYSNVSDQGIEDSTQSLISTLKGFQLGVEDVNHVMDAYNEVGNNFAITSAGIGSSLQRSSAALYEAGNTLEQSIGLITAANSSIQNPEKVGNGLKTVAMRIRGINDETGELMPKLDGLVKSLTGVDLMKDKNTFKSTYDIMLEISKVWKSLPDTSQATLLEQLFGKHQGAIGASLLNNMADGIKATDTAINSLGSSAREQARYMESITAHINAFSQSLVKLKSNSLNSELVKVVVDFGTALVNVIDKIGLLSTVIASAVVYMTFFKTNMMLTPIINAATIALSGLTKGLNLTTAATIRLNTVLGMFAPLAIAAGIWAIIKVSDAFVVSLDEQKEIVNELTTKVSTLQSEYDKLFADKNRTTEQEKYLKLLEQELDDKKALLDIETQRAIQLEFFTPSDSKYKSDFGIDNNKSSMIKSQIEDLKKLNEEFLKADTYEDKKGIEGKILNIRTSLEDSYKSIQNYINKVDEVPPELQSLEDNIYDVIIATDEQSNSTNKVIDVIDTYKQSYEELNKTFETSTSKLIAYNDMIKELEENHKLSVENVNKIFKDYPQLLAYLGSEQELREQLIKLKDEEAKKQREVYIQMIQDSEEFYNLRIKGNTELTNEIKDKYGIDLKNFKTLAEAKEKIESTLLNSLSKKWGTYFDATRNALTTDYNELLRVNPDMAKQIYGDVVKYFRTGSEFNDIVGKFVSSDFSALNLSKTGSGSKKETSLSDILKKEQEYQNKITEAQNKSNNLLNEEYDARLKNLDLEEQAQKSLVSYYESQRGVAKSKGLEDELNQKILSVQGDLADIEKTRKDINKDIVEAKEKQVEADQKNLEDVQKQIVEVIKKRYEIERDEAEKAHKEKIDNLKKEQEEFNKNIDAQIEAIERKKDAEDYNDDISDLNEELSKLQNERAKYAMAAQSGDTEAISIVEDLDEKIADIQEDIEDKQSDRKYELKKQALQDLKEANDEDVEDQIETEDEKYEAIKESYDRFLEEGNLYAEANKALTEGMVIDINGKLVTVAEAFKTFSDTFGQTLGILGNNIQTEFIDKLNKAQMLINTMSGLPANTGISSVSGLNTSALNNSSILSNVNLSSILDKINLTNIMPNFTMPKISAVGGGINMGNININITGSITDKNIDKVNKNITTELINLFTKAGIKG